MIRSFWLALVFCFAASALAEERAVQLLLPSRRLEPTSTFELRFATEMVAADQIGKPAAVSPLVFAPAVEGQFIWLSTRSGTFVPKGILPLATKYQITLRGGLKDAAGRDVKSNLREAVETPPLRVKGTSALGGADPENASATPRFLVLFNANVDAAACAKFFRFTNGAGAKVDARIAPDDPENPELAFPSYQSDDRMLTAWGEKPAPVESDDETTNKSDKPRTARKNVLFVAATKPLPPGNDWKLVIEAGLPAAEWKAALPARAEIVIGVVKPFAIASIAAESNRVAGRRIIIQFSKTLSPEVSAENVTRWISVAPLPEKFKADVEGDTVTLKGDFALGSKYRVTTKAGLPAKEPFKFERAQTNDLVFKQIAARLYFEDFATQQHRAGTRRFRLLAVNVPRIRVTARLFTGDTTPVAIKAYDKYEEFSDDRAPEEKYSRIDVEKLPGQVIWERELKTTAAIDKPETLPLSWDEILGEHKTGAVLLTAESIDPVTAERKRVGTQAVVQLTDIGSVWKRDSDGITLHLFSLTTGQALAGVQLRLLDTEQKQMGEAVTDAQGGAHLPYESESRWVFAQREGDAHLISINSGEASVPLYRLGVTDDSGEDEPAVRSIFLFTERGVYKPGDVVHLKGIARNLNENQSTLPAGRKVTVKVNDAKDREIFNKDVTLSEFASFAEDIAIPAGSLGKYRVAVTDDEKEHPLTGNFDFQVQEYRPNAFEITIPAPPAATGPLTLDLPVTAKYFMGKPLVKAKLTWSLVARDDSFRPEGLADFAFCNAIDDFRVNKALDRISQFNVQGETNIDADGNAKISAQLPINPKAPQPRATKLLCEVTDLSQQTVSESRSFVQHSSDYYFGFRRLDGVFKEGTALPIELIAVGSDGKVLPSAVKSTIRLTRITWQTNRLAAAGDTTEFDSKAELHVEWERELNTTPGLGTDRKPNVATLPDAVAGKPGQYLLEATGKDAQGHDILTSVTFEVAGPTETVWNYRNPYAVDLVTDKESYAPGQTATIMVKTPIAGDALVTVERDKVLRSFVTKLSGNAPSVQVPLTETDAPNVFVSVMLLRGANDSPRKIKTPEYRIGYCEVKVARPNDKLAVTVKARASRRRNRATKCSSTRTCAMGPARRWLIPRSSFSPSMKASFP